MSLKEYKKKRNFSATPEPAESIRSKTPQFVVQLHHASHRHFDFRLELDGVLKSWAVPKGPSFDPAVKRLAMEVEDHPVSYATFEGDIPKGNYGAGHVDVFDSGTWEAIGSAQQGLTKGDLKFVLHGDILRGSWVLVRTGRQGKKNQWLLIKHRDEYANERDADAFVDPKTDRPISLTKRRKTWPKESKPSPRKTSSSSASPASKADTSEILKAGEREALASAAFTPELCRLQSSPPSGAEWLHEIKWDGYRILCTVVKGQVRLWSRNAIEWTDRLPELAGAVRSLKLKSAQLDGEMIVLKDGRDDFNALQARLSAENGEPAIYMLFDLLHLNGKSLRNVPLIDRKRVLADLMQKHSHSLLRFSQHQVGSGEEAFAQAAAAGQEGIVSKRADSSYSGSRNGDWIKVKARPSDEFAVVGFTLPKGSRAGVGALLLGQPRNGEMTYVGRVGTGLNNEDLREWRNRLEPSIRDKPTANIDLMAKVDRRLAIWVKPKIVIEAFYQGIGGQGLLRQPAFKVLRRDKKVVDLLDSDCSAPAAEHKTGSHSRSPLKVTSTKKRAQKVIRKLQVDESAPLAEIRLAKDGTNDSEALHLTHADRIVFPKLEISKGQVAEYYAAVASLLVPEIVGRPLSIVRCPDGASGTCFFQKHVGKGWGPNVHSIAVEEKSGTDENLSIHDERGLLDLVQMNVLEFHPWGAPGDDLAHADRIVFDLDPHASVKWTRMIAAARDVRAQLKSIGLESFVRTSGGKGLHVVVPLSPPAPWDAVKNFAHAVAQAMATLKPKEFVAVAGDKNRVGKIFVDWLRNGRGATSVASYSLRARDAAGVAMPLTWDELGRVKSGDAFTIKNAVGKIRRRKDDPWEELKVLKQALPEF
ncbi:DNA ligase D [Pseudolysobacter antarcticus]|uniref:DNA ligase (ATP) n=1 Tax=Pseudolysobacter antarcticus TaxID=2511995 RepID=A0A411HI02_9GAMM|nr:DNA ligase D [Pseudolysobacter antarcticus]QBB70162.1 DNA ligase D [Pseudolysobacter antarcticus]